MVMMLCFLVCVFDCAKSQKVNNVQAFQHGNAIGVYYDLLALDETAFFITLLVSQDGGATYTRVVDHLSGDVNTLVRRGDRKLIVWGYERQQEIKATDLLFKVVAEQFDQLQNTTPLENLTTARKFEDATVVAKMISVVRSDQRLFVYLSFLNKTSSVLSLISGPYLAVGSDDKNCKVLSYFERKIELKPRIEKQISVSILDVGPEVNFLRQFEFLLGGTKIVWNDIPISAQGSATENR
jgi:hypothetical protein